MQKKMNDIQENPKNQFLNKEPAVSLPKKNHSLEPDLVTGWMPKMKIIGPVPLNFDYFITDHIVETLIDNHKKFYYQVVYLGSRPHNTFKLHEEMASAYPFKYQHLYKNNYSHLQPFFKKFYSEFQSQTKRPFKGTNPQIPRMELEALFTSDFESGNLDAAIRVTRGEYDLFLRIDSNTRGHLQWYYFRVKNLSLKKIKLNIVNFKRSKTLYQRGMKPFIKSNGKWEQNGNNISFKDMPLRYDFLSEDFSLEQYTFKQLSFQYEFQGPGQEVQFAYCVPYTYSKMMNLCHTLIQQLKPKNIINSKSLCDSLSGLELPLLTITNPNPNLNKKCVFVIARQHPGQSNSSYMMEGFLKWITSDTSQAKKLRDIAVIKVVPMLNPDGVILGNFRTSFCGKDLNRLFRSKNTFMFPEVQNLKQEIFRTRSEFKNRMTLFLDLHGHSVRRNVFAYGPGFNIAQNNYYRARIFPKIISDQTNMFRYYSCTFRISEWKQSTARAVFSKYIPFSYTIEASNWSFYEYETRTDQNFTDSKWLLMGSHLANSVHIYIQNIIEQQRQLKARLQRFRERKEQRKQQKQKSNTTVLTSTTNNREQYSVIIRSKDQSPTRKAQRNLQSSKSVKRNLNNRQTFQPEQRNIVFENPIIAQIKLLERKQSKEQQKNFSDGFGSGGEDSESQGEDLNEQELNKFHKKANKMVIQFQNEFFKRTTPTNIIENSGNSQNKSKKNKIEKKNNTNEKIQIEVIACLKKKTLVNQTPQTKQEEPQEKVPSMKSARIFRESQRKAKKSLLEVRGIRKENSIINNQQDNSLIIKNIQLFEQEKQQYHAITQRQKLNSSVDRSTKKIIMNNKLVLRNKMFSKNYESQLETSKERLGQFLKYGNTTEQQNNSNISQIRIRNLSSKGRRRPNNNIYTNATTTNSAIQNLLENLLITNPPSSQKEDDVQLLAQNLQSNV